MLLFKITLTVINIVILKRTCLHFGPLPRVNFIIREVDMFLFKITLTVINIVIPKRTCLDTSAHYVGSTSLFGKLDDLDNKWVSLKRSHC